VAAFWSNFFRTKEEKKLAQAVQMIVGKEPGNLKLYQLSIRHSSIMKKPGVNHNERLEYLGDAVLDLIIGEYLFKKYPTRAEGFLTDIRSRIVNPKSTINQRSIYGNCFEAFIGAVYLDKGYAFCHSFIVKKVVEKHIDFDQLLTTTINFKSKLIEWVQKNNRMIEFAYIEGDGKKRPKEFCVQVLIDQEAYGIGYGLNKKTAEQQAANKTCELLDLN
jgi:ribonuclease-3